MKQLLLAVKIRCLLLALALLLPVGACARGGTAATVAILGDSQTWLGGDKCDGSRGWSKWFALAAKPKSCRSYARSGATWTNVPATTASPQDYSAIVSDQNVIYNQVMRLIAACRGKAQATPSAIIIYAGTNDAWFGRKRPGRFSKTVDQAMRGSAGIASRKPGTCTSLAESIIQDCTILKQHFPKSRLIFVTAMHSRRFSSQDLTRVNDIIDQCARRLGIPVIKLDGNIQVNKTGGQPFTTDGVHTSVAGAKLVGSYVARQFNRIMNQ